MTDNCTTTQVVDGDNKDILNERCQKLAMPENILAYLNKQQLLREVPPIVCDKDLILNVSSNYILVKQILSNLSWQDKLLCKLVSSTWRSAVLALQREHVNPQDFIFDIVSSVKTNFKRSGNFNSAPLVVLTFTNTSGYCTICKCNILSPYPCNPPCGKHHSLLDLAQHYISVPKDCMLSVKACYVSYMPLSHSLTYEHLQSSKIFNTNKPFVGGIYIPSLPDVNFHVININSDTEMQKDFYEIVKKLADDNIIKGVLVYVTEKYLLQSVEDIVFLNYFKDVQPDIPYALGGCIVEDAIYGQSEVNQMVEAINESLDFVSENLISIGIFTVPKNMDNASKSDKSNFDMYSLVIDSSDWAKAKIMKTINEFASKVPQFEHSVVLKLSCVGRDLKHKVEQECFRAAFPNTMLIGCFGNGELGLNHPLRPLPSPHAPNTVKRLRTEESGPQYGIMYSYSTVFLYMGWGKATPPRDSK